MKDLVLLLIRYRNAFLFCVLECIFLFIYTQNNRYAGANLFSGFLEFTGMVQEKLGFFDYYFSLPAENQKIITENILLKDELLSIKENEVHLYHAPATLSYIPARVIQRILQHQVNWVVLNKGRQDGVELEMGVVTHRGIVGVVVEVSEHYALVRTILDASPYAFSPFVYIPEINIYTNLHWKKNNTLTTISLHDIPYHIEVKPGMEVYSADQSLIFPENIPIGKIEMVEVNPMTNRYDAIVSLYADMQSLRHVYLVKYHFKEEYKQLTAEIDQ